MSKRTGDRAKFNREHKKRVQRRKRNQELRQTLEVKAPGLESPPPAAAGKQLFTSRLRHLTGDQKNDATAFEIVVYQVPPGGQNE
ncbi:MAG TPA: hypothetical protein VGB07_18960 [Blastocatellia bacterium]|jgi:hypothetical protein